MASTQASKPFSAKFAVTNYMSGDVSSATDTAWVDMRDFDAILISVMSATLTGDGTTVFKINANPESDGSGSDVEIKAHAVGSAPDAVGDWLFLECTAEEITAAGDTLRFVSATLTADNSSDRLSIMYIRRADLFAKAALTADVVA